MVLNTSWPCASRRSGSLRCHGSHGSRTRYPSSPACLRRPDLEGLSTRVQVFDVLWPDLQLVSRGGALFGQILVGTHFSPFASERRFAASSASSLPPYRPRHRTGRGWILVTFQMPFGLSVWSTYGHFVRSDIRIGSHGHDFGPDLVHPPQGAPGVRIGIILG